LKRVTELAIVLILLGISSWAQEIRHELTVQASGFFTTQTTENGLTNKPTNSAGVLAGYRFNLKKWLAVEGDYDYFRNGHKFLTNSATLAFPMNVHAATGAVVVKLPVFKTLHPFVLGGGGAMFFDPRGGFVRNEQTRGAFIYGGGVDLPMFKHVALRAQCRGFIYKTPDFQTASLNVDKYSHSAVPSAGLVFAF